MALGEREVNSTSGARAGTWNLTADNRCLDADCSWSCAKGSVVCGRCTVHTAGDVGRRWDTRGHDQTATATTARSVVVDTGCAWRLRRPGIGSGAPERVDRQAGKGAGLDRHAD